MKVTFDDSVPEAARETLAWSIPRGHKAGLAIKSIVTRKPGTDSALRKLRPEDRIVYVITVDENGDAHVTTDPELAKDPWPTIKPK